MMHLSNRLARQLVPRRLKAIVQWQRARSALGNEGKRIYDEACARIDVETLAALSRSSSGELANDPAAAAKYYDHRFWLTKAIQDAMQLDLHRRRGLRILDIGCGPGWFLAACQHLGHDAVGMDLPREAMREGDRLAFLAIPEILRCADDIVREPVTAFKPLSPDGPFDLVTCHCICFDGHWEDVGWDVAEWTYFLDDVDRILAEDGRVHLRFNPKPNRYPTLTYYDAELRSFFASRGHFVSDAQLQIKKPGAAHGEAQASP